MSFSYVSLDCLTGRRWIHTGCNWKIYPTMCYHVRSKEYAIDLIYHYTGYTHASFLLVVFSYVLWDHLQDKRQIKMVWVHFIHCCWMCLIKCILKLLAWSNIWSHGPHFWLIIKHVTLWVCTIKEKWKTGPLDTPKASNSSQNALGGASHRCPILPRFRTSMRYLIGVHIIELRAPLLLLLLLHLLLRFPPFCKMDTYKMIFIS